MSLSRHYYLCIYVQMLKKEKKKTTLLSLRACFVIAHSLGDFNDKNIPNHRLYTVEENHKQNCTLKMFILLHVLPPVGTAENYNIQKACNSNPKQI